MILGRQQPEKEVFLAIEDERAFDRHFFAFVVAISDDGFVRAAPISIFG